MVFSGYWINNNTSSEQSYQDSDLTGKAFVLSRHI